MKNKVRMKDLAKELNISVVSVSKALSDKEGISDELKTKIKSKAEEMGYVVDVRAKSMKSGKGYNIGIIIPEYFFGKTNNFYFEIYGQITSYLHEKDFYSILYLLKKDEIANKKIPRFCYDDSLAGIICLGQINKEYLIELKNTGVPLILSDFYENIDGITSVETNNYLSGFTTAKYLYDMGHREIGFVGNLDATNNILDRYMGCQKFCIEKGLTNVKKYLIDDRDRNDNIFKEFTLPKKMPTSFICNCDEVAFYFIKYLKNKGYKVPEDISVISFDNTIFSSFSVPSITTYVTDTSSIAEKSVSKILEDNLISERIYINGSIIERESVQKFINK